MSYLDELNEVQRNAVTTIEGPVMIIAGPGSGKTRVLTYRIAHLMQCGVDPFNILALTFTNKAAKEMRNRIESIAGTEARSLWMGTFHSVFARLLRSEAPMIGYPSNFTIYDTADTKNLIKRIVKEQNLNPDLYKPGYVYSRISAAKNSLVSPAAYAANYQFLAEDEAGGRPKTGEIYRIYTERCFRAGAMDFDDLLLKTHQLISQFPEVLYKYQHKFQFLMIDEFQDTNKLQYDIVKKLAASHENIAVVGDDAQSIYAFRGATIQNILNFQNDYPDLKIFKLEQNYRSTKKIVEIANKVIGFNRDQIEKSIWTDNAVGERIKQIVAASDSEEGKIVSNTIFNEKMNFQRRNKDFAILYRTNAQSRAFEESLRRMNIPYKVYGGLSFYQRKEVKDMLAYLRLTVNFQDEEALRRVINYPTRGIGATTLQKITILANQEEKSFWDIVSNIHAYQFPGRVKTTVGNFAIMIKSFNAEAGTKNAYELAHHIGKVTNLQTSLHQDKTVEGMSRYENYQELLNSIQEFCTPNSESGIQIAEEEKDTSLGAYLQQVALLTDQDNNKNLEDSVSLMTIHAAKGLEFPVVFVVGMEEELFPSRLSVNSREEIEEERRLFYVAVTRGEKKIFLSYAKMRYRYGKLNYCEQSRFLEELSELDMEMIGSQKPQRSNDFLGAGSNFGNKSGGYNWQKKPAQTPKSSINDLRPKGNFKKISSQNNPKAYVPFQQSDITDIQEGRTVKHERFGTGLVEAVEKGDKGPIATILFNGVGRKRILLRFAKLQVIS